LERLTGRTYLSINASEMRHAYQKMGLKKFKGIFRYGLKYLRRICA
jgi:hypothetical protein